MNPHLNPDSWGDDILAFDKHFCELILMLDQLFSRKYKLNIFYLELCRPFCSLEQSQLYNYARGVYEKHFCETILNLDQCSEGNAV